MSKCDCYSCTHVLGCANVDALLEILTYPLLLDYMHEHLVNVQPWSATRIRVGKGPWEDHHGDVGEGTRSIDQAYVVTVQLLLRLLRERLSRIIQFSRLVTWAGFVD